MTSSQRSKFLQYYVYAETNGHRLYFLPIFILLSPERSLWASQWLVYQSLHIRWVVCHLEVSRDHPDQTFKNIVRRFLCFDVGFQWQYGTAELKRAKLYKPRTVRKLIGKIILPLSLPLPPSKKIKFSRALVMDCVAFSYVTLSCSAPVATCMSQWARA